MPTFEENKAEYEKLWAEFQKIQNNSGIFSFDGKVINKVPAGFAERIKLAEENQKAIHGALDLDSGLTGVASPQLSNGIRVLKEIISQAKEAAGLDVKSKPQSLFSSAVRRLSRTTPEPTIEQKIAASTDPQTGTINREKAAALGLEIPKPPAKPRQLPPLPPRSHGGRNKV